MDGSVGIRARRKDHLNEKKNYEHATRRALLVVSQVLFHLWHSQNYMLYLHLTTGEATKVRVYKPPLDLQTVSLAPASLCLCTLLSLLS